MCVAIALQFIICASKDGGSSPFNPQPSSTLYEDWSDALKLHILRHQFFSM